jgi:hypothetical protein
VEAETRAAEARIAEERASLRVRCFRAAPRPPAPRRVGSRGVRGGQAEREELQAARAALLRSLREGSPGVDHARVPASSLHLPMAADVLQEPPLPSPLPPVLTGHVSSLLPY